MPKIEKQKGAAAENFAEKILAAEGYEILERNFRYSAYEVDLIAKINNTIHFVEVKFREKIVDAHFALSYAQFHRISKAAEYYMRDREEFYQIDAFLVDRKLHWERIANIMIDEN